jgi:membrane AbrB-like protein
MDLLQFFFLTLIGGLIAIRLRIPGGGIIGPMIFVGLFQSTEWVVIESVPNIIRWAAQSMLGVFIGLQFSKKVLKLSRKDLLAFSIVSFTSVLTSFLFGYMIYRITDEPYLTAVISAVPGSIAEMLMLADSMNLDTQPVAVIHLLRFILLLTVIPFIVTFIARRLEKKSKSGDLP